jgi:hypothetical protein
MSLQKVQDTNANGKNKLPAFYYKLEGNTVRFAVLSSQNKSFLKLDFMFQEDKPILPSNMQKPTADEINQIKMLLPEAIAEIAETKPIQPKINFNDDDDDDEFQEEALQYTLAVRNYDRKMRIMRNLQNYVTGGAKKCSPPQTGKSTNTKKATNRRVKVGAVDRVVYEGPRGGQYIKMNGGFVNLKSLT